MTSTGQTKKIDSLGRITVPKSIRDEMMFESGDIMEFFRCEDEVYGKYIGMKKISSEGDEDYATIALRVLEDLDCDIPQELLDKIVES
jgi:AbrB family looped-hinge helix DNA binding protein